MMREFSLPPRTEQFAELVRLRLEEVRQSGATRETVSVDWNGQPLHVEVIDLPLRDLYYNPATHRVRAQRSHDPKREKVLDADPWEMDAQNYLRSLLQADPADPTRRDPEFDRLKDDLSSHGQNEPGLITHQGILVNGNTRAAALRELGVQVMRVGVLPASFTWGDINAVELSLQLRRDHRRDYSFINHLLALEEQAAAGRTAEDIARIFRIKVKTYEQDRWILQVIRDQIERSKSEGASLRLVDFEDSKEKFKELHRDYMKAADANPDQAEVLKEARLTAIMLGFAKTDVPWIDGNFHENYLTETMPDSLPSEPTDPGSSEVQIPGLGVAVPGTSAKIAAARQISRMVLQAKARVQASQLEPGERAAAQSLEEEMHEAFDKAIDRAGRDGRLRKRKQMAPERLMEACAAIDLCVSELVKARGSHSFDEEAFDEAVVKFKSSVQLLARQAGRGNQYPGPGLSWLLEAAEVKVDQ